MNKEEMIIIDKKGKVSYTCEKIDGCFCMPLKAIKEMQKKMTYDEAVIFFFNCVLENKKLKERIDKAIEYIEENCGVEKMLNLKIILKGDDKNE